ncbi:hypothetical protein T484DRAFT_1825646 [Baffinella frigidus]|nr:hypothetical protein T484DRAFT_1825646 [Cryptophyta sp. CCMP2293]
MRETAVPRTPLRRCQRFQESLSDCCPLRGGGLEKKDPPLRERLLDVGLVGADREFAAGWGGGTRGAGGAGGEEGNAEDGRGDAAMVVSDNMMTADQMEAHADIAMEAGEPRGSWDLEALDLLDVAEALDLLDVAVNERVDEFGEDSPECIEGYFMYAKSLMLLQNQRDIDAGSKRPLTQPSAGADTAPAEENGGDVTGDGEEDDPCSVARKMLERLADVLELLGRLSLSGTTGEDSGGHAGAQRCFEECLVIREELAKKGWEKGAEALREARSNLQECRAWL